MNVSIKWLHDGDFRRFTIVLPETGNGAYDLLLSKCTAMVPNVQGNLAWKDSDGDLIRFSSDAEMREAMGNVTDGVLRLFTISGSPTTTTTTDGPRHHFTAASKMTPAIPVGLTIPTPTIPNPTNPEPTDKPMETENEPKIHRGVTCDGCEKNIAGYRFKCGVCPDYDLCYTCHEAGQHREHAMIRIADPSDSTWRALVMPPWMRGGQGHWGRGHHGRRGFGRHGSFQEGQCGQQFGAHFGPQFGAQFGPQPPQAGPGHPPHPQPGHPHPDFTQFANAGATFLREVGEQVAAALTTMGIDVDVDVKDPAGNTTRVGTNTTTNGNTTTTTTNTTTNNTTVGPTPPAANADNTSDKHKETTDGPRQERQGSGDWTMVGEQPNEDDGITITKIVAPAATATGEPAQLYPTMPQPAYPSIPISAPHPPYPGMPQPPTAPATTLHHPGTSFPAYYPTMPQPAYPIIPISAPHPPYPGMPQPPTAPATTLHHPGTSFPAYYPTMPQPAYPSIPISASHPPYPGMPQPPTAPATTLHHPGTSFPAYYPTMPQPAYPSIPISAPHPPYPGMPQPPTAPATTLHHPDPAIHHAVEHMMAMGFQNEGGWLTQLLELKKGNISAALDALAPHGHIHRPQ